YLYRSFLSLPPSLVSQSVLTPLTLPHLSSNRSIAMEHVHSLPSSSIEAADPPTDSAAAAAETVETSPRPNQDSNQPRRSYEAIQVEDLPTDAAVAALQVVSNVEPRDTHPSSSRHGSHPDLGNCFGLINMIERDTRIGSIFDLFEWTITRSPKTTPLAFPRLKRELCSKQLPDESAAPAAEKSPKVDARLVLPSRGSS
ncbi:hypothetical protein PENTCL1PPCAC_30372, partial [Pristionchus entomophagus]